MQETGDRKQPDCEVHGAEPETGEPEPAEYRRALELAEEVARRTAADLVRRGVASEAWAEGIHVRARIGRYTCVLTNHVRIGPPGTRRKIQEAYINMLVGSVLERAAAQAAPRARQA